MRVAGAGILGGLPGMIGAAFMGLIEELIRMGPDTVPPLGAGRHVADRLRKPACEPVTPGTLTGGAYTTLATTIRRSSCRARRTRRWCRTATAAYQSAAME